MVEKNHKRMLLDIVNRDYINCEKTIYQDFKKCNHIEIFDDEPVSSGRIKMFLKPHNINGELILCIEQDHCRYINDFTSHWIHNDIHFDSFLRENFTVHDTTSSIEMFKNYISKISFFIPDFPTIGQCERSLTYKNKLNGIHFEIMMWTVRRFVSSTEIQIEYNMSLSLKENANDSMYSNEIFGVTIENGIITDDFYNDNKDSVYFSVDDLVFKTLFSLHPKLNTIENNTFAASGKCFDKELYEMMVVVDEMQSI